jgi:hypothetical protein
MLGGRPPTNGRRAEAGPFWGPMGFTGPGSARQAGNLAALDDLGPGTRPPARPVLLGLLDDLTAVVRALLHLEGPDAVEIEGSQAEFSRAVVLTSPVTWKSPRLSLVERADEVWTWTCRGVRMRALSTGLAGLLLRAALWNGPSVQAAEARRPTLSVLYPQPGR